MDVNKESGDMRLRNYLSFVDYRADRNSEKWTNILKEYGRVIVIGRITDRLFGLGRGDKILVHEYSAGGDEKYSCAAEIIEQSEVQCRKEALNNTGRYCRDIPIVILGSEKNENESYTILLLSNLDIEATIEAKKKARDEVSDKEIAEYEKRRNEFFEHFEKCCEELL